MGFEKVSGMRVTPQLADRVHVGDRQAGDTRAAIGDDLDEPVALEADQRLAHRRLADAELGGDSPFDERVAWDELPADDVAAEDVIDVPLEAAGTKRRN